MKALIASAAGPVAASSARRTADTTADVLRRWAAGHDTAAIAAAIGLPEAEVCRIVAADQDRRHALGATAGQRAPRPPL